MSPWSNILFNTEPNDKKLRKENSEKDISKK